MGKWGGQSGGCGLPPQYRDRGEQQRPGQTENVTVRRVPYLVPRFIVTLAVPGLSWDSLTSKHPCGRVSQDRQYNTGGPGILCHRDAWELGNNSRTADVTPVFWDTSNLGWVSLSKDNPTIAGVTLPYQRYLVQYVHATTGHV